MKEGGFGHDQAKVLSSIEILVGADASPLKQETPPLAWGPIVRLVALNASIWVKKVVFVARKFG